MPNPRIQGEPVSSPKPSSSSPGPSRAFAKRKTSSGPPNKSGASGGPGSDDDNPFLALARAHGTATAGRDRDAIVKDLDKRLETVRQAVEIEAASERRRPGEPVDQELRDLVAKWRGAGRAAAEELFETVRERVDKLASSPSGSHCALMLTFCSAALEAQRRGRRCSRGSWSSTAASTWTDLLLSRKTQMRSPIRSTRRMSKPTWKGSSDATRPRGNLTRRMNL